MTRLSAPASRILPLSRRRPPALTDRAEHARRARTREADSERGGNPASVVVALALAALGMASAASVVTADGLTSTGSELIPADLAAGDHLGFSAAISGDVAAVGTPDDDDDGLSSGSATVFERIGAVWVEAAKLTAPDGAANDRLGTSISVSGDTVVAGAPQSPPSASGPGHAYVFERSGGGWSSTELTASDGAITDGFGESVAVSGDTVVIGALADDDKGLTSGSAYVFEKIGAVWIEVAKLTAADGAANDRFGTSVAIDDTTAIVGAVVDDDNGTDSGSAYVFEKGASGWSQVAKLTAADGAANDHFGTSVAISGATAVVGARYDDDRGAESGSAYVFSGTGGGWVQVAKLTAADGGPGDQFGTSVATSGDTVLVGAFNADGFEGSAHVFDRIGGAWTEVAELKAPVPSVGDAFGSAVSLTGNTFLVGASHADAQGTDSGSAWVFERLSVEERLDALASMVEQLGTAGHLNRGQVNSLVAKIEAAERSLARGQDRAATNQLAAFANAVQGLIDDGVLTPTEGQPLIDQANAIIDQILAG